MATIKSYSDLQQSKVLAEILPIESADMLWGYYYNGKNHCIPNIRPFRDGRNEIPKGYVPAWSLAALLSLIPQEIFDGEYIINVTEGCNNRWVLTYDHFENRNNSYYSLSIGANNLVDACYEMILKLHERKML